MAEVMSVTLHTHKKGPVLCVLGFLLFLFLLFLFNFPPPFTKPRMDRRCSAEHPEFSMPLNVTRVEDGQLVTSDGVAYPPNAYWKHKDSSYQGCPCLTNSTCVRKCCSLQEVLRVSEGKVHCERSDHPDPESRFRKSLKFYQRSAVLHQLREISPRDLKISILPNCKHFKVLTKEFINTRKFMFDDGTVWDKYYNEIIDQSGYCVETVEDDHPQLVVAGCQGSDHDLNNDLYRRYHHRFIRNTIRSLSLVFYLVSFLVFAVQPSIRQGYGRWLMCYLAARFFAAIQIVNFFNLNLKYPSLCIFTVMVLQFSELSSQAWQIVIFYHIWLALRPDNHSPLGSTCSLNHKRFMYFSAVAWGVPLVIVILTVLAHALLTDPGVVLKFCWYNNRAAKTAIMSTPHVVTDLVILVLCGDILRLMREYKRDAATLPPNNIRHFNAKEIQWSCIYVEVSIVVTINYLFMSFLLFLDVYYAHVPNFLYYTVESIETMRGVDIFFIFVCHKSLLFLIRKLADNSFQFMRTNFQSLRRRDIPLQRLIQQNSVPLPT